MKNGGHMSMNPARSFASALAAWQWTALWIYFTAPPLGMLAAAEVYVRRRGTGGRSRPTGVRTTSSSGRLVS